MPVVVRTFTQTFDAEQRDHFLAALDALCRAPLEHPSIARPVAYGVSANGRPYVIHAFLPGTPLTEFSAASGRRGLEDIVNRLTYLAGALDFAAATGVFHGALTAADVIVSSESAGVSGLGLVQALEAAGIPGFHATRQDDVAALMRIAQQLLADRATPAASSILSGPPLSTALEFATALHRTVDVEDEPAPTIVDPAPQHRYDLFRELDAEAEAFMPEPAPTPDILPEPEPEPQYDEIAPVRHDLVDIQLRHDEEKLVPAPSMFGVTDTPVVHAAPRRSRGWLLMAAVAVAFGVFAGFAGGFFAGRESTPSSAPATAEAPKPEATNGRSYTDAPVAETPVVQPPAQPPTEPPAASATETTPKVETRTPPPQTTRPPAAAPRAQVDRSAPTAARPRTETPAPRSGPAAIRVESLPAGAQVFVDGKSVGYAPLIVGDLTPGTHSIRMQLPGYRPFVTAVTLGPGARERLAASLEQ